MDQCLHQRPFLRKTPTDSVGTTVPRVIVAHANPARPLQVMRHMRVAAHVFPQPVNQKHHAACSCGSLRRPAVYGNLAQMPGKETDRLGKVRWGGAPWG